MNRKSGTTTGRYSVTEGYNGMASGDYSHAEGNNCIASGDCAHAEGYYTRATGSYEGAPYGAHAEGAETFAEGINSHAEGGNTHSEGPCSHAEGFGTIAHGSSQHVQGKYNVEDNLTKYADIVGNGTTNANRKNIEATTWTGDKRLKGTVYINCNDDSTGGTDVGAAVGDLSTLTTTDKTSLVSAINEVDNHADTNTANFAPAFSEVTSYAVGDYVTYNGILYRCTTNHTAGVWVASHFTQVTVGRELSTTIGSLSSTTHIRACAKTGNLVTLSIDSTDKITITNSAATIIGTLPEAFKPKRDVYAPCCIRTAGGWAVGDFKIAVLRIYPNGDVAIVVGANGTVGTGYYISAQVTYNQLA
jgi:hypothetical protein